MLERLRKQSAGLFVTSFIGLIIISFVLTGYQSIDGNVGGVASVNGHKVTIQEFETTKRNILQYYRSLFGGKDLSLKQQKDMNITKIAMDRVVEAKLLLDAALDMQLYPGSEEVSGHIKSIPEFMVNEKFDVIAYKRILQVNSITPKEFEKDRSDMLAKQQIIKLFQSVPTSSNYTKSIEKFRHQNLNAKLVKIDRQKLTQKLPVTEEDLSTYLAEPANAQQVESLFQGRKESLSQQEEVLASHILFKTEGQEESDVLGKIEDLRKKITVKNFSHMAKKHTEDISGKDDGGDLGWFARGKMVKEFDDVAFTLKKGTLSDPVKTSFGYHLIHVRDRKEFKEANFEEHKDDLATELIRKTKLEELKELVESVQKEAIAALEQKKALRSQRDLKKLVEKYELQTTDEAIVINRYDGLPNNTNNIFLSEDRVASLFKKDLSLEETHVFSDAAQVIIARVSPFKKKEEDSNQKEGDLPMTDFSRKLTENIISYLKEQGSVKINSTFLARYR